MRKGYINFSSLHDLCKSFLQLWHIKPPELKVLAITPEFSKINNTTCSLIVVVIILSQLYYTSFENYSNHIEHYNYCKHINLAPPTIIYSIPLLNTYILNTLYT